MKTSCLFFDQLQLHVEKTKAVQTHSFASPCCAAAAALHSRRQKPEHQTHQRLANLSLTSSYHITSIIERLQISPHQIQPLRTTCNQNTSHWVANQNYRVGLEFVQNCLQFQLDFYRSSFTILLQKNFLHTCFTYVRIIVFVFGGFCFFWFVAKVGIVPQEEYVEKVRILIPKKIQPHLSINQI